MTAASTNPSIGKRFRDNLGRVNTLIQSATVRRGRPSPSDADRLRAAVVFLHATLEDLLRSNLEERWHLAPADKLSELRFPRPGSDKPKDKLSVAELAEHRGRTVSEVIQEAAAEHLKTRTFNHPGDIQTALDQAGYDNGQSLLNPYRANLAAMMSRRHHIVHRADRNEVSGRGQHNERPISRQTLTVWYTAVADFGKELGA